MFLPVLSVNIINMKMHPNVCRSEWCPRKLGISLINDVNKN